MILLIMIGIIVLLGVALYPVPGMIVHDRIYFAIIDGKKEKAIRLYERYAWLMSKSDKKSLEKRILTFVEIAQMALENQKENNGNG